MQQTFQCYRCGAQNYWGQPYCWNCQAQLQHNCPNCHALVEPTLVNCPYCHHQLSWQTNQISQHAYHQAQNSYQESGKGTGKKAWLIGVIATIVIIAIGIGIIYAINNTSEPAQTPPESTPIITDLTEPQISMIRITASTGNNVVISWVTDEPSSSQVVYGPYPNANIQSQIQYDPTTGNSSGVLKHEVSLNVQPLTSYIYHVISLDKYGNRAVSPNMNFDTASSNSPATTGIPSPKVYKPAKSNITFSAIDATHIQWSAGNIIFVDGTTQKIEAGSLTLTEPKEYWVYWVPDNKELQATTNFSEAVGQDRGALAIINPGYNMGEKASIVTSDQ